MPHSATHISRAQHVQIFDSIIKPKIDFREYRGVRLSNGLRVMLISDPTTDKAAAALDVNVGSLSDPSNLQGLAHFLEHMLFLGTKKYPSSDDYSEFLAQHAGYNNAYTSATHTNYYFDVDPTYLEPSLDRFAQFFIAPLFNAVYTEKELNAVHSEYEQYLDSDRRRSYFVDKETCDPTHDYHKFTIGNRQTLKEQPEKEGIDVRQELLNFHAKWYSANLMSLTVLGKESLDQLYEMVVQRLPFSQIASKNVSVVTYDRSPYDEAHLRQEIKVVPIKDMKEFSLSFPIPDYHSQDYRMQPSDYLSHLIGHEGEGSLLSALKQLAWVNSLSTYGQRVAPGMAVFGIRMELTELGLENTDSIIEHVFQYLHLLKSSGVQQWIFDECSTIKNIKFDFKEKEKPRDYVSSIASNMHDYPIEEVLRNYYIPDKYRPDIIKDLLSYLVPNNMRVMVTGKKFEGFTDRKEKYFAIDYSVEQLSDEKLKKWAAASSNEKLHLPAPNAFIPANLELVPREPVENVPIVIKRSPFMRVWYQQDNEYNLPKAFYGIHIKSSIGSFDPLTVNCLSLYIELLKDSLNEYAYSASLAGLDYSIDRSYNGIVLKFSGYSDKLHVMFEKVTNRLLEFDFPQSRFDTLKELYMRRLKNFFAQNLYRILNYYYILLSAERGWTIDDYLETMDAVTYENVRKVAQQFYSNIFIEALLHGNVRQESSAIMIEQMKDKLVNKYHSRPAHSSTLLPKRHIKMAKNANYILNEKSDIHQNNAISVYYQLDMQSTSMNVLVDLLNTILNEKFYNNLRTEEQLGYVVFMYAKRYLGVQGISFFIQSAYKPEYLDSRIENFINWAQDYLVKLSEQEFNVYKESLRVLRCEVPKKLINKSEELWNEIHVGQYNFNRRQVELDALQSVTKQQVIDLFTQHVLKGRRKLAIRMSGEKKKKEEGLLAELHTIDKNLFKDAIYIKNITTFQNSLETYPIASSFIDVV